MNTPLSKLIIPAALDQAMQQHLANSYPDEGCGIMIGNIDGNTVTLTRIVTADNQNRQRGRDRFEIDPGLYIQTEKNLQKGEQVVGFYHSHPDCPAVASQTDREFAVNWPGFVWLIYRIDAGQNKGARSWILNDQQYWQEMQVEIK